VVDDPDAPGGVFTHWIAWGLDPAAEGLGEGEPAPNEGQNDFGTTGYRGPCPPSGPRPPPLRLPPVRARCRPRAPRRCHESRAGTGDRGACADDGRGRRHVRAQLAQQITPSGRGPIQRRNRMEVSAMASARQVQGATRKLFRKRKLRKLRKLLMYTRARERRARRGKRNGPGYAVKLTDLPHVPPSPSSSAAASCPQNLSPDRTLAPPKIGRVEERVCSCHFPDALCDDGS
jgi:hypothetical protein